MRLTRLLTGSALAGLVAVGVTPAFAQTTSSPSEAECATDASLPGCQPSVESTDDAIVVTGSRIMSRNLDLATPVTTITPSELMQKGDLSLGDALSQLPSMRSTFTQANSTGSIGTAGINGLDLRGLGTARTLVLVNGRRRVTAQPGSYLVDINTIPSALLEKIETVTGGNSAIYGSDAIAGVVNFITKKDFEGLRISGQAGATTYGDRGSYSLSAVAGHNFADGRFNITGSLEYTHSNALFFADRDYLGATTGVPGFITSQITTAPNRNFDGIPNTVFVDGNPGITFGNLSTGGYVLTSCAAANASGNAARIAAVCTGQTNPTGGALGYNFAFLPDGTLVRDDPSRGLVDNRQIGGGVLGGLSATGVEDAMLYPGIDRINANLFFNGNISDAFNPFVELGYVRIKATQQSTQPTFVASTLSPTFSTSNPFLTDQAREQLALITGGASTFTMQRFNNDLGTRAENHKRETYLGAVGSRGKLSNNLNYEVSLSYGRTETYYETGGNVHLQRWRNAVNAVRNGAGQIVCGINADTNPNNDDPNCAPLNLFGYGAATPEAKAYVLQQSWRKQKAEQLNAIAFISGDTGNFLELPGGPIGFALGGEYREEKAFSTYDDVTKSGATFLNAISTFDPPKLKVKEAFAELKVPILANTPFFHELTLDGAGRVSDYGGKTGSVWAYNVGLVWAPVSDLRFRASYAKSVRAPNLSNLYATPATTFQNGFTDPCDQAGGTNASNNITSNPNREKNCRDAGIPTSITYTDAAGNTITRPWTNTPGSGLQGINRGNDSLLPEVGKSFTLGAVFQPTFLPGFAMTVDYYNIKVKNVISGLTGQAIINRCYDDPGGINNVFCDAISRRTSSDPLANLTFDGQSSRRLDNINGDITLPVLGASFYNQPFNFAALKTSGIDADIMYRHSFNDNTALTLRALVSYLIKRESYSYITEPNRSDRLHGTLGDPVWAGSLSANLDLGGVDLGYSMRFVGKQIMKGFGWETFFPHQGRPATNPDARPMPYYPTQTYHNFRIGVDVNKTFEFYTGVDNAFNQLPPYDATGTGDDAIYPALGRFFYAGFTAKF
ncbi:TonB-dependent receptor [Pseudonocardia sp. TMWB2A]|uniref:TonB-dependent receptor domain-containing protein n=1 Tax=Pseudonocardia sp. TMWB2A TaxID=687430 RepID=UPI00307DD795